jgi:RNA polymerase sigma factor (sigma-70 family)
LVNEEVNIDKIIIGCKAGDRTAQEQLYRSFYRVMMNLCVRYTKNQADAMEVLNTGFYKVFKNIERYEPAQATLYTWIRTIIINSCLDFIKSKQKVIQAREVEEAEQIDIPPDVISKMTSIAILELVRQLPPATQAVFNLYVIEGYSHKEIAQLLQISNGTSKWHLSEARKILQTMLQAQQRKE